MFGDSLKELRKQNKLTQKELGEKFGVKENTISYWENNLAQPSYEILKDISDFFNVSTDFLLGKSTFTEEEEIDMLYKFLSEAGYDIPKDMTLEDLEKAFKLLQVMKGDK